jgi:hypothetical protein
MDAGGRPAVEAGPGADAASTHADGASPDAGPVSQCPATCSSDGDCANCGFAASRTETLNAIFGTHDHDIHMFCQPVGVGYGVCAPCPGIVNVCGAN